jgi:antitoxin MazE
LILVLTSDILYISDVKEVFFITTTIVKWGNSRGIRLPKPFLENLNLKDNDTVDVLTDNDTIIIKKTVNRQHKTLKQRVEEFYGKDFDTVLTENPYEFEELDWGKPVGKEVW